MTLQEQIDANFEKRRGEVAANATRLYWRSRLADGDWVPTRRVLEIVVEDCAAIRAKHERLWPEPQSYAHYQLATHAERWLVRERQSIRRLIDAESRGETLRRT